MKIFGLAFLFTLVSTFAFAAQSSQVSEDSNILDIYNAKIVITKDIALDASSTTILNENCALEKASENSVSSTLLASMTQLNVGYSFSIFRNPAANYAPIYLVGPGTVTFKLYCPGATTVGSLRQKLAGIATLEVN